MSVDYCCVARRDDSAGAGQILCDCNIKNATAQLLSGLIRQHILSKSAGPNPPEKQSFKAEQHTIHVLHPAEGKHIAFICACSGDYPNYMAYQFLAKIAHSFFGVYREDIKRTPAFCGGFAKQLKREADFYNSPEANKLRKVQSDIDQVKNVMVENLDAIIQRGEKIDTIVDRTSMLADESHHFLSQSTALRKKMWWKNVRIVLVIVTVVVLIVFILVVVLCGGFKFPKC
jgi:vesicle-associated membrane protein 7